MKIQGILFDFDGTIANTNNLILKSFKYTLKEVLNIEPEDKEITKTFGLPLPECMKHFNQDRVDELLAVYRDFNLSHHDALIEGYPKVKETLKELKKANIRNCVVTSKKVPMAKRGLKCLDLEPYFDGIIGCDVCTKHKPEPEPMFMGAEVLNLSPRNCLCVGDSPYDLISGKAAGCKTIAVNWSQVDATSFDSVVKPDYRIDEMTDLLQIIKNINGGNY